MQMTGSLAERAIAEWRDYLEIQREMAEQEERERRARRWAYVRRRLSILIAYLLDPYGDWHYRAEEAIELAAPYLEGVDLVAKPVRFEIDGLQIEFVEDSEHLFWPDRDGLGLLAPCQRCGEPQVLGTFNSLWGLGKVLAQEPPPVHLCRDCRAQWEAEARPMPVEEASPPPSAAERLAEAVLDLLRERGLVEER